MLNATLLILSLILFSAVVISGLIDRCTTANYHRDAAINDYVTDCALHSSELLGSSALRGLRGRGGDGAASHLSRGTMTLPLG
jgi:hypothetical protein